ncbi:hypothetical protein GE061_012121 [Apolygus lucorum]|uniref:Major facilitator superfamily (MFS) profile domain-containing protein n=1 Tax=Apolygus lucorum TaxID=248454 RepID=A0A8S9XTP4_APOLU|nr:hypothetical protein GE061_012121 [Apolygus lucorum]
MITANGVYLDIACMAARFFGGMTNSSLTTIVASMYPTLMRTLGLGWGNLFTSIGLAVATNIVLLSNWKANLPLLILGISGLLGSLALLFLPGRVSRDLLDLPEEVEYCHKVISAIRRQGSRASPLAPQWNPPAPFPSAIAESDTTAGADVARKSPSHTSFHNEGRSESSAKTVLSQPSRKRLF